MCGHTSQQSHLSLPFPLKMQNMYGGAVLDPPDQSIYQLNIISYLSQH